MTFDSGSKLHALHTLRAVRLRRRRALSLHLCAFALRPFCCCPETGLRVKPRREKATSARAAAAGRRAFPGPAPLPLPDGRRLRRRHYDRRNSWREDALALCRHVSFRLDGADCGHTCGAGLRVLRRRPPSLPAPNIFLAPLCPSYFPTLPPL